MEVEGVLSRIRREYTAAGVEEGLFAGCARLFRELAEDTLAAGG
jgi:hypothetical protein